MNKNTIFFIIAEIRGGTDYDYSEAAETRKVCEMK